MLLLNNNLFKMRKLQILKAIIDFIWILWGIPSAILLILFVYFSFSSPESISMFIDFEDDAVDFSDVRVKLFLFVFIILFYVCFYCFYLFRKTIRYFQKVKILVELTHYYLLLHNILAYFHLN